jgi:recombination protein RecA
MFSHCTEVSAPALRLLESVLEPLAARVQPGRVIELSGGCEGSGANARTSTAVAILRQLQAEGETAVWVQPQGGALYPPDLHEAGIDLDALVVVHIAASAATQRSTGLCKAAELLIRSGAFGLVVIDMVEATPAAATVSAWLGRMLGLARQHDSRVVLLTEKPTHADSVGTLVGLRIESHRHRDSSGSFVVEHHVIKNKSGAPFDVAGDRYRGPDGLLP